MCGINGFTYEDTELITRMNNATKHRGPDGTGAWVRDGISLGHNRLAIIDPRDIAAQPMQSADGTCVLIFNGEIYNFRDVRKELVGYPFKTESDTEVIIAAYQRWGQDAWKKLNGIFALALYDSKNKTLTLVRDPKGVKPLYYARQNKQIIFSSEIKAILEHPVSRVLNMDAFNHYLRVLYVPAPHTMFQGIQKLPPGHAGIFHAGTFAVSTYVTETAVHVPTQYRERVAHLSGVIDTAVARQLVSDKPLGIYLSGGIDSSIVLDAVSRVRDNIDTFSVGFTLSEQEEPEKFNADFNMARITARHYGTHHHEVLVSSDDAVGLIQDAVWHLDEPIANPTVVPMFVLARFAKKDVDVVLGGDGGDELFGGYDRYRLARLSSLYRTYIPHYLRDKFYTGNLAKLNTRPGVERFAQFLFQKENTLARFVVGKYLSQIPYEHFTQFFSGTEQSFMDEFLNADEMSWLVDESLTRSDKMAMASGLEARVPLLDLEVVRYAHGIPVGDKVTLGATKKILKDAYRGRIPDFLFHQPKRGWFSPGAKWLRHERVRALVREVLSPEYHSDTAGLFDWEKVTNMFRAHEEQKEYHLTALWALITFQLWAKQYMISTTENV